jgi:hypothetical protein
MAPPSRTVTNLFILSSTSDNFFAVVSPNLPVTRLQQQDLGHGHTLVEKLLDEYIFLQIFPHCGNQTPGSRLAGRDGDDFEQSNLGQLDMDRPGAVGLTI